MVRSSSSVPVRDVVIAGGGIAGIEGLLRLWRLAGDRVRITLLSPEDEFVYRPLAVMEPFTPGSVRRHRLEELIAHTGARHVQDRLVSVDASFRLVSTGDGRELHYDALLLALGAGQSNPYVHAALFTDRDGGQTFRSIVDDLDAGRAMSLAFVVPNWPVWTLPLYELALLTAHRAQASGMPVQLMFVTAEARPLKVFGRAASDSIERLLDEAGIELFAGQFPQVPEPGRLRINDGELAADRIVTLPHVRGPGVHGVPAGTGWFTPIDGYCRVPNTEGRVFAAGDATDSPVKHGGLGAQQADAAAAGIAHLAGAAPRPDRLTPLVRGMLLTGEKPLYLMARLIDGLGWESEVHEECPWPLDDKVVAEELGPRLAALTDLTVA
jgi:sulfide:quinone oxidoreductase